MRSAKQAKKPRGRFHLTATRSKSYYYANCEITVTKLSPARIINIVKFIKIQNESGRFLQDNETKQAPALNIRGIIRSTLLPYHGIKAYEWLCTFYTTHNVLVCTVNDEERVPFKTYFCFSEEEDQCKMKPGNPEVFFPLLKRTPEIRKYKE